MKDTYSKPTNRTELSIPMNKKSCVVSLSLSLSLSLLSFSPFRLPYFCLPRCCQVAAYRVSGELQLNTETLMGYSEDGVPLSWPSFPKSQCMAGHDCLECLSPDIPADIVFVPGGGDGREMQKIGEREREREEKKKKKRGRGGRRRRERESMREVRRSGERGGRREEGSGKGGGEGRGGGGGSATAGEGDIDR